jgi:polar amino acid transport system permease protein
MQFDWTYFFSLFTRLAFWEALVVVIKLSTLTWLIGLVLGFLLASAKLSSYAAPRAASSVYIWFFRSVPLLVLLVFVYNMPQMFPALGTILSDPFYSGLIALVITEAAYMAEIHRGGLLSVQKGQKEAGRALGIGTVGIERLIVIPQAFRISLPSLINEYITVVKLTSLASVISLTEILTVGQRLYARNFLVMETLAAVAVYYVLIVTVFGWLFTALENYLDASRRKPNTVDDSGLEVLRVKIAGQVRNAKIPLSLNSGMCALDLRDIYKRYGTHDVLKGVSLKVAVGEVVSIIGPSGSGKTSLIRTVNGLEVVHGGEILLFGQAFIRADEPQHSSRIRHGVRKIGMVFQNFNLFPHRTVVENVTMAPRYHNADGHASEMNALSLLDKVGLLAHYRKYPHQLSGGQQQRVAIARALAMSPELMLFDEPTSALDPELVGDVLNVIRALAAEGMTMVIVTHEMDFAMSISDRVVFMEEGVIQLDATPEDIRSKPEGERVRRFMGLAELSNSRSAV